MILFQNPVFLTQMRLVHRAGVLAAVLIAGLTGLGLLAGLIYCFAEPQAFVVSWPQGAGGLFYAALLGVETLVLVGGGFSRISRVLAGERKAGLWDSNRLTPLQPSQLMMGYWFGTALREFYMSAVLSLAGLVIVLLGRLPVALWAGTQILLLGTALFFGLPAMMAGMALPRPRGGILFLLVFFLAPLFTSVEPRFLLAHFLVPSYATVNLFNPQGAWSRFPEFFGVSVHPIAYRLGLQFVVGLLLWRAVARKAANPFQPLLRRREAVTLFGVIVAAQHGLIWGLWRGHFGTGMLSSDAGSLIPIVQGGTLLAGAVVLAMASPLPERVRVEALRAGFNSARSVFSRSAASSAVALAAVGGAAWLAQCALSITTVWRACLAATANSLAFFAIFSLLLEFCRLRFQRRAPGFFALGLFLLCLLPFVLAGVFSNPSLGRLSLLAPGIAALAHPADEELNGLLWIVAAHFAIALLLFIAWRNQWRQVLRAQIRC